MFDEQTLIFINIACIVFMIMMLAVLAAATRMKGGAGWVAVILVTTNIPIILVNLMRDVASAEYYLFFMYPAYSINVLIFPAMWFFTQSQMDKSFRLTKRHLINTLPALVSLGAFIIYYAPLSAAQVEAEIELMKAGGKNLPGIINDYCLHFSLMVYFTLTICYARKRMKYLRDHFSDSDYTTVRMMPRILAVFIGLVLIAAAAYIIYPRSDIWVIPMVNMAGMTYLIYCVIFHSTTAYISRIETSPQLPSKEEEFPPFERIKGGSLGEAQMKEVCDKVMNYLTASGAYINPDLSLSMLSVAIGISHTNLSRSMNGYLKKNFFDIINEMRVEEAKKQLRLLDDNFTIDSVAEKCGFSSSRSFYRTFKKYENTTPNRWMKKGI